MTAATLMKARDATVPVPEAAGCWFEATTAYGPIRLRIAGAVRHAADVAVALGRAEALTCTLEEWIGAAIDWRRASPARGSAATHTYAHGEGVLIEWPWALLRALPAPPEALLNKLQWPETPVMIVLARLGLPAAELAQLEPGGAVLIAESYAPAWRGVVRAVDEAADAGVAIAIDTELGIRTAKGRPSTLPLRADQIGCEIRLDAASPVRCDRLTGWVEGEPVEPGLRASLWRTARAGEPARCLAIGQLAPWAKGWALAIETAGEI